MIKSKEEVEDLVRTNIERLKTTQIRDAVSKLVIEPRRQRRTCLSIDGEAYGDLWIFAQMPGQQVGIAYSDDGFGALGFPWGLVFVSDSDFGSSGAWYSSLFELIEDSGYFMDQQ